MSDIKRVSMAVIKRLPLYHQSLGNLLEDKVERVSSQELSSILGFTASQIRQDLNNFGEFGQQGYGYNVEQLYKVIARILGLNVAHNMILIGAGNLGQALANYDGFADHGFNIIGLFDIDTKLVGKKVGEIPILHTDEMDYFINKNDVDIAILTVPQDEAQKIVDILLKTDIKGLWNFTSANIVAPPNKVVKNVNLIENLFTLSYHINEDRLNERLLKRRKSRMGKKGIPNMVK